MNRLFVGLAALAAPVVFGTRGTQRLSVLIYHRVLPQTDPMRPAEPTVAEFDWQMRLLRAHFNPLPLVDAVERLQAGTLPENAISVTFDDGYADNERHALPVLQKYQIPATVFISTGFLNGGRMWNDSVIEVLRNCAGPELDLRELGLERYNVESPAQRLLAMDAILRAIKHRDPVERLDLVRQIERHASNLPEDLMLTDAQVRSLARANVTIGAHTVNHPILNSLDADRARAEIRESKQHLEALLQKPVEVFAYPNGRPEADYRVEHRDMVSELGFKAAVSTHWGVSTSQSDRLQLPRFTPWDRQELKFACRLLASYRWVDPLVAKRR